MALNASFQVVASQNQPQPLTGDIIQNDVEPPLTYRQKRIAQQALQNANFFFHFGFEYVYNKLNLPMMSMITCLYRNLKFASMGQQEA